MASSPAGTDIFYKAMRGRSQGQRYASLECQPCKRNITDPRKARCGIRFDPDALDSFTEHLRGQKHQKIVARLEVPNTVQIFRALDGTTVKWDHVRCVTQVEGEDEQFPTVQSLDWTPWQQEVNKRERDSGQPVTSWLRPSDRGDGAFDDGPFAASPYEESCFTGSKRARQART